MKHAKTNESLEVTQARTPACTLQEAHQLLEELKADYDALSPAARRAVCGALKDAAAQAPFDPMAAGSTRVMISLSQAKAYWWHLTSGLSRFAWLVFNFICDPIAVLPTIIAGLWKPTPRESDGHAAN